MGTYVAVRLFRERVEDPTWERIYSESLRVLHGWADPPLGTGYREVAGVRVIAYTRAFEDSEGWCIHGDANSRRFAESFSLPTKLCAGQRSSLSPLIRIEERGHSDVLYALVEEDKGGPRHLSALLDSKTQRQPYHALIVAIATLIENRLPGIALATGDFHMQDAHHACVELERILGETFEKPVLLEPTRIQARLPDIDAVALSSSHTLQIPPEVAAMLDRLRDLDEMESKALVCTDSDVLSWATQRTFVNLGLRLVGLTSQMQPLPVGVGRDRAILSAIAAGTRRQRIVLTDMAWDDIESAGNATLEFLYWLSQVESGPLEVHQALRAVYENPVVRDLTISYWNEILREREIQPTT